MDSFGTLDVRQWRYHLGNVPNVEDPNLDDSSWPTITAPRGGLPAEAVWFRREIAVPRTLNGYDLTNSRIEFYFSIDSRGSAPLIIYLDGRRVALGADLAPIVLWEKAKPGDHVLVAVKALATDSKKSFRRARVTISTDPARPSPSDFYKEILSASWMLPAIPGGNAQVRVLEQAVDAIDTNALDQKNQGAFDASLRKAHQILEPLKPLLEHADIHMVGNSHMDVAWLWPWTETVHTVRHTFGTSLQLMNEYPQYTYTQSTALYFQWMQNKYPVMFSRIKKRVKEGRFELVGGMWVETDLNMPSGESQVRQILLAKRYFEKNFGVNVKVGWNPDSFGYNWQLPQIYKKSGIDYFVTQKMSWNDTNQLPLKLFWWQAPDGSRVLTYFPHGYSNSTDPIGMARDYAQAAKLNPGIGEMMHLYGVGDHGGGPTRVMVNQGLHWEQPDKVYSHLEFGTSLSFFQKVQQHLDTANLPVWNYKTLAAGDTNLYQPPAGDISLPVWNDELYLEFHRGTYTTQAAQKRDIRDSEEWMLNAEKYSSLAWLGGAAYPRNNLNEAWKKVLFNEFHDLAAGSGIADIYKDAARDFQLVHYTANRATSQALGLLTSYIDTRTPKGAASLLVFNPMAWRRTDILKARVQLPEAAQSITIKDSRGRQLPVQILNRSPETHTFDILLRADNVPALGYERLTVAPAPSASSRKALSGLTVDGTTLENQYLRVVVDPKTGCITSLYDKQAKFESIAAGGCGNQLQAFHNNPTSFDAWNINPNYEQHPYSLGPTLSVKLIESGPLRAVVRVTHATQKSKFTQDITLYAGLDRVDVVNNIDWHEHHILLKAAFPLSASSPYATYEIPYGNIERPTTRNNSVEKAKFEVPAIRWGDLGNSSHGFSLINNSKYGYDAKGNVLRLTLLRSATSPDPTADLGPRHFVYSLYPHPGTWKQALTERHGWDFNYKLKAIQVEKHTGALPAEHSFFSVEPDNIILSTVKKAEDSNALILRFYEWAGKDTQVKIHLPPGATSAIPTNLMEIPEGSPIPIENDSVTVEAKPYSIDTIKVAFSGRGPQYWAQR
ncbi:MAG: glycoside hydrolase family 38 C-terminal domain-containing protein [Bryobacteraceae bacterium]